MLDDLLVSKGTFSQNIKLIEISIFSVHTYGGVGHLLNNKLVETEDFPAGVGVQHNTWQANRSN